MLRGSFWGFGDLYSREGCIILTGSEGGKQFTPFPTPGGSGTARSLFKAARENTRLKGAEKRPFISPNVSIEGGRLDETIGNP